MSRFRCGCHGLHIDTGRFVNTPRDDRVCEVCKSECVANEHHFLFDCPAYAHIRYNHATLFHGIQTVSAVVNNVMSCLRHICGLSFKKFEGPHLKCSHPVNVSNIFHGLPTEEQEA